MISTTSREPAIDAIRGLALFGVLVVNLPFFAMPDGFAGTWWRTAFPGPINEAATFLIRGLFENKFILIFSFLFGYGAARQLAAKGIAWYRRRLLVLAALGVAHAVLFSPGDILLTYAIVGLVIPYAARWSNERVLRLALFCWALSIIGHAGVGVLAVLAGGAAADPGAAIALYGSSDFLAIMRARLLDWATFYAFNLVLFMPLVASLFLLGVVAFRELGGRTLTSMAPKALRLARFLFWPALLGNLLYGLLIIAPRGWAGDAPVMSAMVLRALFSPLLAVVLFGWALHVFTAAAGERFLRPFQINGRFSLSIYVAQSVVCGLLFFGYGFGLYGSIGPAGSLLASLLVYLVLTGLAEIWSLRFERGPLEALMARLIGRKGSVSQMSPELSAPRA